MVLYHHCNAIMYVTFIHRLGIRYHLSVFSSDLCTGRHPSGPRVCPLHRLGGRHRFGYEVILQVQEGKW